MHEDESARAESLYARGDYEGALSVWENVERANPEGLHHWYKKGVALRKLGRFEEAITALERPCSSTPKMRMPGGTMQRP